MSPVTFPRMHATTASVLLATVALSGCSILGGLQGSVDISKLPNIPEGQKQQLISQMQSASGSEKQEIAAKAKALSKMVGTELVGVDPPPIIDETFKLDPNGQTVVNKDDKIYQRMSATDYWRLGQDTYDLCVEQDCEYYSSWTVDVEGSGADLTYVWTLKVDGDDQPKEPLVRRFKAGK
ncbi:hypothetical protein HMPREF1627_08085 [Actinomyces sp. S6-Spd3]|uniref:hypothetical protein n=1 Tax=Actinomyces sp. S6-Spd3 TaxID=1284680 RepID=UPI00050FA047|nr:hypothetical protein [Actinomyces sp. S6-Spd3]KGE99117.1 hypothetical protein HMPREF1627_08085 [Actinomyces sp. S6-Spd3]